MLERNDVEEKNARCNLCSIELSIIEIILYSNRCMFCGAGDQVETLPLKIGLREYLVICFWDWKLYQVIRKLWKAKGKEESKMLLLGCLAEMGKININEVRTIKDKRVLYRLLKFYLGQDSDKK